MGIIEITTACNLRCPVCFADAGDQAQHLSLSEICRMMDRLVACEGQPEVLQIHGGEPTLHPELIEILRQARKKGYRKILLNTNGLRLVEDPAFLDQPQKKRALHGLAGRRGFQ